MSAPLHPLVTSLLESIVVSGDKEASLPEALIAHAKTELQTPSDARNIIFADLLACFGRFDAAAIEPLSTQLCALLSLFTTLGNDELDVRAAARALAAASAPKKSAMAAGLAPREMGSVGIRPKR